ncbi:MAG: efflux RND transporter permease subunit, partial [Chroococcales cyanobacterium]
IRDWRVTLITGTALPLSIIPTFLVMKILGYTLNGMTLLALALAIGNLVDDAICMIENIDQHLQMGKRPFKAALDGSREIGLAVVATTATIVAVFLPVAFMGGIPGQFFQPFGVTVSVSTMFSTLVATTMTPLLSAYLLKPKEDVPERAVRDNGKKPRPSDIRPFPRKRGKRPYRTLLLWALRHRITTLLIAVAFFIGSLQLVPFIPKGLFNSGDTGLSTVLVELPPGSSLDDTEAVMLRTNNLLQENPAVASVLATAQEVDSGTMYVNLVPKDERELSQQEFEKQMREQFAQIPGARVSFRSQGAGGSSKDLSIVLKSEDAPTLKQTADALEAQMREIPGLVEVTSSASLVKPEIVIIPNTQRAADLGVSVNAIARTASLALIGDNESNLAKFNLSDRQIPIRIQLDPKTREDISTLKNLRVPGNNGDLVPISAVADIRLSSGAAQIDRFDRARQVLVEANLQGLSLGEALETVRSLPAMNPLPPGVSEEPFGDAEIMRDIFTRFVSALGLAVLSIYAILVLLYNNFLYPLAILVALPLSIGGALLALLMTQKELGLFALIGIVLLMGLVTKNAILLVDFALAGQQQGKSQFKSVFQAGVSRLRPILMTSVSTIAGMIPIALEIGADGEVRSPMAIAVIGGFSTSTLLTLVVVPVLFTYVDNFYHWLRQLVGVEKKRSKTTGKEENEELEVVTDSN